MLLYFSLHEKRNSMILRVWVFISKDFSGTVIIFFREHLQGVSGYMQARLQSIRSWTGFVRKLYNLFAAFLYYHHYTAPHRTAPHRATPHHTTPLLRGTQFLFDVRQKRYIRRHKHVRALKKISALVEYSFPPPHPRPCHPWTTATTNTHRHR